MNLRKVLPILILGLLTPLASFMTNAQLPLPANPNGIGPRSGEASLQALPPFSGSQNISNSRFGEELAYTTDLLVVGAPGEEVGGFAGAGAIYVFEPDGSGGWQELSRISAPTPVAGANFGTSISLVGNGLNAWIVVGAPNTEFDPTPGVPGDEVSSAGKVYLFKPNITPGTWDFAAALFSPAPNASGHFGTVVDIWDNGGPQPSMFIGAPGDIGSSVNSGAVYLYQFNGGMPEFPDKFSPSDEQSGALFGTSIARVGISAQPTFFVGAPGFDNPGPVIANMGKVYSYFFFSSYTTGDTFVSTNAQTGGFFGKSLSIHRTSGDNYLLAVGAPAEDVTAITDAGAVYVFDVEIIFSNVNNLGSFPLVAGDTTPNGKFGASVSFALTDSLLRLLVGAPTAPGSTAGRSYLFDDESGTWEQAEELDSFEATQDLFGASVILTDIVGKTVAFVGAPRGDSDTDTPPTQPGTVYVFQRPAPAVLIETSHTAPYTVSEDGSQTFEYTLVLTTPPIVDVTIDIDYVGEDCIFGDPIRDDGDSVTFTPSDWMMPYSVRVLAVNDDIAEVAETCTITHTVDTLDTDYSSVTASDVIVDVASDDTAGVETSFIGVPPYTLSEDGSLTETVAVALTSQPTNLVVVKLSFTGDECRLVQGGTPNSEFSLTFTTLNWDTTQILDVEAIDDTDIEGTHTCTLNIIVDDDFTLDSIYDDVTVPSENFNITDNDAAGITYTITQSPPYTLSEDGTQLIDYTIVLDSQPTGDVAVSIDYVGSDCDIHDAGRDESQTRIFTSADWNFPQGVTLQAIDDTEAEGTETCSFNHTSTSSDSNYNGLTFTLTADVIDDDSSVIGVELVRNASMEDPHPIKPIKPEFWVFRKFVGKERRICPGSSSPKVHSGNCAVQFSGNPTGPRTVLRSTRTKIDLVDNFGFDLSTDDTIRVRFFYKLSGPRSEAVFQLVTFRNFGGDWIIVARVELPHPSDGNYAQWLSFDETYTLPTTDFKQLRLILKDFSKRGKWWVDDVSMLYFDNTGGGAR